MKSSALFTIHDLIATDYNIEKLPSGKFRHSFSPATTGTVYEFEANESPVIEEGERYNIGYTVDSRGRNIIDQSALSLTSHVTPMFSFMSAQHLAYEAYAGEKAKNDLRVSHAAVGDYYWGKKYAWRMFGGCIAKEAFFQYLDEIGHPSVPCITRDPAYPSSNDQSTAYAETGLEDAVKNLIESATRTTAAYFTSPLYSRKFTIKGVKALTHKK